MAGTSAGQIDLDLVLQSESFQRQLNTQVNAAMKKVDKQASGMTGTFGKLGKVIAAAFAVKQIVAFGKECLKLGSDLAEVQNVVDVTFGNMNEEINRFAKNAITAYGLSETVAKKYAGTFGAMAKSFGFAGKDAVAMSETLTGLAGDVASFYNMSTDEAYTKLKSVFTGETESLKELGVVMTQTALDQFAMQKGFGKTTAKMTEQEKVALRYAFVLDKLSDASGDFARTSDSWANQTRVLALRFDALKASIGQGLINVLTPVVKWLNIILAKLQVVADAFANFTAMLMGKKQSASSGTAAIADDLASAAGSAADTAAGMGGTAAAAKKAAKSLMAIDELNTLTDNSDSGGGGGGTGASASGISMPDLGSEETAVDAINGKLSEMKKFLNDLKGQFLDGFKLGYKDADFQAIIDSLKHIGQMVKDIFTSPEVVNAAKNWALTVANSLGKITGAVARTAVNIGNTLVGGVEKYFEQHGGDVKQFIVDMFDISAQTAEIRGNLAVSLADILGNVFGTEASKQLVADVINIFATVGGTIVELSAKLSRDMLGAIAKPIIDNVDSLGEAAGHLVEYWSSIAGTISKGVTDTAHTIQSVYDTYISPMFAAFGNGMSQIVGAVTEAWNTYIAPVLQEWGERFSALWAEHLQPCIDSILVAFGKVCQLVGVLWENYLAPFIAWFKSNIYPVIAPVMQLIGDSIMILLGIVSDVITGIMTVLQGALDFLIGVFTLDWGLVWQGVQEVFSGVWTAISGIFSGIWAGIQNSVSIGTTFISNTISTAMNAVRTVFTTVWNGIKSFFTSIWSALHNTASTVVASIANGVTSKFRSMVSILTTVLNGLKSVFSSVFNGLVSLVKTPINAIIGMINKLIGGLNTFKIDVPSWVPGLGGKSFGFHLSTIPMLANGGYVAANSPQLAMIGDNRHEGEIVAPESKIAEAVAAGMASVIGQLTTALQGGQLAAAGAGGTEQPINIYLGNELLDSIIVSSNNRRALRNGGRA